MKIFVLVIGLMVPLCTYSQQDIKTIDSLNTLLARVDIDKRVRIDALNKLAVLSYNIDLKKSMSCGEEALSLSRKLAYDKGTQQALNILMRVNRRLGNFTVAIELALNKLPIAEKLRDTTDMVDSYSALGNIYSSLERYEESKKYLTLAYELGKTDDATNLSSIMNFIGRAYTKMGKYDSAQYWIEQALRREQKTPQPGYTLSYIYNNLAEVFYFEKKYDAALAYYLLSSNLPDEKKSPFGMTYTLNGIARIYKEQREYQKSILALQKSLDIALKNAYRDRVKEAYGILYEVYEEKYDFKNALLSYKQFNLYQDSIFSEDNIHFIENLKVNYETERVARENDLLKKDADLKDALLREQRSLEIGSAIAILSLLALSSILYLNYKQKKKTNLILAQQSEELEKQVNARTNDLVKSNLELIRQNNQLEQFGFITAHNLRAPVARILGLTSLITGGHVKMPEDKVILDKLHYTAEELDGIIHDLNAILEIKKGLHKSYEKIDLPERLEKVKSILRDKIHDGNVTIRENLKVETIFGIAVYVESILYNLISNAVKYRAEDRSPVIEISSSQQGDFLVLTVKDNGLGINLDKQKDKVFNLYQRFHTHVEGKGLGLFLVKTQVEALNGRIEIDSKVNKGTTFTVYLPLKVSAV